MPSQQNISNPQRCEFLRRFRTFQYWNNFVLNHHLNITVLNSCKSSDISNRAFPTYLLLAPAYFTFSSGLIRIRSGGLKQDSMPSCICSFYVSVTITGARAGQGKKTRRRASTVWNAWSPRTYHKDTPGVFTKVAVCQKHLTFETHQASKRWCQISFYFMPHLALILLLLLCPPGSYHTFYVCCCYFLNFYFWNDAGQKALMPYLVVTTRVHALLPFQRHVPWCIAGGASVIYNMFHPVLRCSSSSADGARVLSIYQGYFPLLPCSSFHIGLWSSVLVCFSELYTFISYFYYPSPPQLPH